jgi:hypothetical protein
MVECKKKGKGVKKDRQTILSQFFQKNENSSLCVRSKKENIEYRSIPYDPIRSKMNVVPFRTIRIVRKRTMTCRQKKYTKKLFFEMKPTLSRSIDLRLPIQQKLCSTNYKLRCSCPLSAKQHFFRFSVIIARLTLRKASEPT